MVAATRFNRAVAVAMGVQVIDIAYLGEVRPARASGRRRLARFVAWLLGLGLLGTAHVAWRAAAAALGIAGATALIGGITQILAASGDPATPIEPAVISPAVALPSPVMTVWQTVTRPIAVFGLEAPDLDRMPLIYTARRAVTGPERDDILRFGKFTDEGSPHLHLSIQRSEAGFAPESRFFVEMARETAQHDLGLGRMAVAVGMPSKFGVVETADTVVAGTGHQRACIAFRHISQVRPLRLSGWWCGTAERPADRKQLTCLIDRLDLLSAGEDRTLRQFFAQAELNRQEGCSVSRLAVSGRKPNWLDADAKIPALKKSKTTR
jgi:hypothetical protein